MSFTLSRKILVAAFVLAVLSFVGLLGLVAGHLVLLPSEVLTGGLWRLVTYVLVPQFLSLILVFVAFSTPGEELEQMFGVRRFGSLLLGVTVGAGLLHLLLSLLLRQNLPLTGSANLVLFVLVGFVYLFPQSEVRLIFFSLSSRLILILSLIVILASPVIAVLRVSSAWPLLLTDGLFGGLAALVYFHLRYQKYALLLGPIRRVERVVARMRINSSPQRREVPQRVSTQQPVRIRIPFQRSAPREMSDEERLDAILEKINERGVDALTDEERRFLDDYASRL